MVQLYLSLRTSREPGKADTRMTITNLVSMVFSKLHFYFSVSGLENESIDDLLEQELLLRVSPPFNTTRHRPKLHTTNNAQPTGRSVRPMKRTLKEFNLEDDLLIPIGRESLSRERRQVVVDPDEGSGTPANIGLFQLHVT